ncbi:hypothetical protein H4R19_003244 [Coemansia spiralis]|nr:hypothetical protein H4R19_003244 [Coemansia spiralis]
MLALTRVPRRALHMAPALRAAQSVLGADPDVYSYAAQHSEAEPPALQRIRLAAQAEDPAEAQKMISPHQGAFMASLVRAQRPRAVLELGCYVGYSALWLAHGLDRASGARLWTCERDSRAAEKAQANIASAGFADTISVLAQPAASVLESWDPATKLDLIFIDANKSAYQQYYDLVMDRGILHDDGQIIVDNVLFRGKVHTAQQPAGTSDRQFRLAAKIRAFNEHVASDLRTSQVILPVFDGLLLIQKSRP